MNILAQTSGNSNPVTMTSPEIVDFINAHRQAMATTEKPYVELHHRSFMAKVPQVLGAKDAAKFIASSFYQGNGSARLERQIYVFPKREACLMAMSYSYELQAQIFDRMTAMEEALKAQKPTELSRMDLIQLALQAEQENIALRGQVAILEPKAQALEVIADTTNTYCIRECAKTIGIKESDLIKLLIDKKWVYRDSDRKLQPHAQYVTNNVFTNRASPVITNRNDGKERVFLHMRVTAFGLTRITGLVERIRKIKVAA